MAMHVVEPSGDFTERLRQRLRDEARYLHIRLSFFGILAVSVLAVIATPFMAAHVDASMQHSGFVAFLSLWGSDTAMMLDHWQDAALSLLESLPVFDVMMACVMMALLLTGVQMIHDGLPTVWKHFQRLRRGNR